MFLGELINIYRMQNKITLQEFADKCELSKGYIAMLEKNFNPKTKSRIIPSLSTFSKVSHAMGLSLDELMAKVDEDQPVTLDELSRLSPKELVLKAQIDRLQERLQTLEYSTEEQRLIECYRQLPDSRKIDIADMMRLYLKQSSK